MKTKDGLLQKIAPSTAIIGVILIVAIVATGFVLFQSAPAAGPASRAEFSWKSFADAAKTDSDQPKSVEITAYQVEDSGYGKWNFRALQTYQSSSAPLSYNPSDGIALVKEVRSVDLAAGLVKLALKGTSAHIDPTSLHLADLSGGSLDVLEQNYDYDLVSGEKILQKYVDKEITVESNNKTVTGTLLSPSGPVLKTGTGITLLSSYSSISFPSLPEGFVTTPTINWLLDSKSPGNRDIEVSYLTSGVNWNADYVAIANKDDSAISLQGWVSLRNDAGMTFKDAKLKLVAGDINIIRGQNAYPAPMYDMAVGSGAKEAQFKEQGLFEYHMYTLNRPTTIASGQVKQVELLSSDSTPAKKEYVFEADGTSKVQVKLSFENSEDKGLGLPLPKGKVRVYKADSDGQLQFVGEDGIDHTPKDETVRLSVGNAFDIVGEKTTVSTESLGSCNSRSSYKIDLRNHKKEDVTVRVVESAYGDWEVLKENFQHAKESAYKLSWEIPVKADGTSTLEYTITSRYC